MRIRRLMIPLLLGLVMTGLQPATAATASTPGDDFYTPPATITGQPGDLIKQETSPVTIDPTGLLLKTRVQRIMYVSETALGTKVAVTGLVFTPARPWRGKGARPLIGYAIGTQGLADRCAASRQFSEGLEYEEPFIATLLAQGYAVTVSDYQGLGTPGEHPYVNRLALGHDVLDSIRAATRLTTDPASPDAPVLISGYSEGGGAAAGALELQPSYAPEINLVGGYAGAIPADFQVLAKTLQHNLYAGLLAYTAVGIDTAYPGLHLRDRLNDKGRAILDQVSNTCLLDMLGRFPFLKTSDIAAGGKSLDSILAEPDIHRTLLNMEIGNGRPGVPVLVFHSHLDDALQFAQGKAVATSWCRNGATVRFQPGVAPTHVPAAIEGFPYALAFFRDRLAGKPFVSQCPTLAPGSGH